MTIYTHDGRVFHHNDCTYCVERQKKTGFGKRRRVPEVEICGIDGHILPPPHSVDRYCEYYRQIGCDCPDCTYE